jgi:hypothetical protein
VSGPTSRNQRLDRDPLVARALRSMPVPDHRPGFWGELEARLALIDDEPSGKQHEPAVSPTVSDQPPVGLDATELPMAEPAQTDSRRERRRRQRRLLLRVAAVSLVIIAGSALLLSRPDDRTREPVDEPNTTTAVISAPTTLAEPRAQTPAAAVRDFVQTVEHDSEAAYDMLTNESRDFLGSPDQLTLGFADELSAWSSPSAVEQKTVMVARSPAETQVAVVTYTGTLEIQGAPQPRTQAYAVLREGGAWRISLTATALSSSVGPAIDMINPAVEPALECCGIGGVVAQGEPIRFRAAVTPEIQLVSVAFDGGEALNPAQLDVTDTVVTARPQLDPGQHVVTIAIVLRDGVVYARAVQFVVG